VCVQQCIAGRQPNRHHVCEPRSASASDRTPLAVTLPLAALIVVASIAGAVYWRRRTARYAKAAGEVGIPLMALAADRSDVWEYPRAKLNVQRKLASGHFADVYLAEAIGIDVKRVHWLGFAVAGAVCGIAGGLFAFAKGSISPETIHIQRSIDGLVMVLLGGVQTLTGPIAGAAVFTTLQDMVMRDTEYWRAMLGGIILALVLLFPDGIVGGMARLAAKLRFGSSGARP